MSMRTRPPLLAGSIEPCLPTSTTKPPSGPGWLHEVKHDGYRLMAHRDAAGVRLLTRNGHDWSTRYPAVLDAAWALKARSFLLDGELTVLDQHGLAVFDLLRHGERVKREACLLAFDLLELNGTDLRRQPIEERKAALAKLLRRAPPGLQLCEHLDGNGAVVFEHACGLGCEGIVSKRLGSTYRSGRSRDWLKVKSPTAPAVRREAEEEWGK
jgi:bifunctional non-homologous end joining protein LigD